jgi:5-methylcytosine-specific restriction endonuclease McrA
MEKEILQNYLEEGYSLNQISKLTGKSLTSVRYWKDKYSLKSSFTSIKYKVIEEYGEYRFCPRCQTDVKTDQFYKRRGKDNSSVYCKSCTSNQTLERVRSLKLQMIEYKGGCCVRCGYDKYQGALEFHHLNPKEKDFNPSRLKNYSFNEKLKNELNKCILVCSNCHREIHDEIIKQKETH